MEVDTYVRELIEKHRPHSDNLDIDENGNFIPAKIKHSTANAIIHVEGIIEALEKLKQP